MASVVVLSAVTLFVSAETIVVSFVTLVTVVSDGLAEVSSVVISAEIATAFGLSAGEVAASGKETLSFPHDVSAQSVTASVIIIDFFIIVTPLYV